MISETRTVYFEQPDLVAAVDSFSKRDGYAPTRGNLVEVIADPAAIDRVTLKYITDAGAEERILPYVRMRDILIEQCGRVGVPLPRRGQKHVAPAGPSMALVIRLSDKTGEGFLNDMERIDAIPRRPGYLAAV